MYHIFFSNLFFNYHNFLLINGLYFSFYLSKELLKMKRKTKKMLLNYTWMPWNYISKSQKVKNNYFNLLYFPFITIEKKKINNKAIEDKKTKEGKKSITFYHINISYIIIHKLLFVVFSCCFFFCFNVSFVSSSSSSSSSSVLRIHIHFDKSIKKASRFYLTKKNCLDCRFF